MIANTKLDKRKFEHRGKLIRISYTIATPVSTTLTKASTARTKARKGTMITTVMIRESQTRKKLWKCLFQGHCSDDVGESQRSAGLLLTLKSELRTKHRNGNRTNKSTKGTYVILVLWVHLNTTPGAPTKTKQAECRNESRVPDDSCTHLQTSPSVLEVFQRWLLQDLETGRAAIRW